MSTKFLNKRQYFRYDIHKTPWHIAAEIDHNKKRHFSLSCAIFFSDAVKAKLEKYKNEFELNLIDIDTDIQCTLKQVQNKIECFNYNLEIFCNGYSPFLKNPSLDRQIKEMAVPVKNNFNKTQKIKEAVKIIDQNVIYLLELLRFSGKNSTENKLIPISHDLFNEYKADLSKVSFFIKNASQPLKRGLEALKDIVDLSSSVLKDFLEEQSLSKKPKNWKLQKVNLSAGGFSLHLNSNIPATTKVGVYFKLNKQIMSVNATIVQCNKLETGEYLIRGMFNRLSTEEVYQIESFIQSKEIKDAMSTLNWSP